MKIEEAKKIYLETLEKENAFALCSFLSEVDLETAAMPDGAVEYRSRQLNTLAAMEYDLETSADFIEAVTILNAEKASLDEDLAHEIEVKAKSIENLKKIPKKEYTDYTSNLTLAYPAYVKAKLSSDFSLIAPYYEKIFDFCRKQGQWCRTPERAGYDVLLDAYEPFWTTADYDRFFDLIKRELVPFVKEVTKKRLPQADLLKGKTFPKEKQKQFCEYIRHVMCFDNDRTGVLESEHPFTINNGNHDVRITNHYYEDNLVSSIFSAIHEMGHGLYELQIDDRYEGTGCSGGVSLAMHESQSRLMENMIGRSRAFWDTHFGALKEIFPEELAGISAEDFYVYVNSVECSLIRTEADELTYSLHVLIRYEIEKMLIANEIEVADLPRVWNEKYKEYLGVDVPCDREGVLQDMHWSGGSVGYFPTYALGSAYAAQFMNAMKKDIDVDNAIREGTVASIALWLKEHIHKYGSSKYPKDIIKLATGEDFDAKYYVEYLKEKYGKIYNIG